MFNDELLIKIYNLRALNDEFLIIIFVFEQK